MKFSNFLADMGERPEGMSLDRIDNDGNYTPENCRWTDAKTQVRNSTTARLITHNGMTKCLAEWAEYYGVGYINFSQRIRLGYAIEDAIKPNDQLKGGNHLITFNGKTQNVTAWAKETGINRDKMYNRIKRGWSVERILTTP